MRRGVASSSTGARPDRTLSALLCATRNKFAQQLAIRLAEVKRFESAVAGIVGTEVLPRLRLDCATAAGHGHGSGIRAMFAPAA